MLGACASASAATVYKWVDANGVTHYSDQPNPNAQKLEVGSAQTYASKAAAVAPPQVATTPAGTATAVCVIDSPGAGQVFQDANTVTGHVTLANGGEGSRTMLRLDGQDISALVAGGGSFTLSQLDRGDHTLTVQVTNSTGDVTCQGTAVTFSIRQRSVIPPTAPTAPTAPVAPGVNRH
jgi:hypothetical protein